MLFGLITINSVIEKISTELNQKDSGIDILVNLAIAIGPTGVKQ